MGDVDYIHSLMGGTRLLLGEHVNMKLVEYDEGCYYLGKKYCNSFRLR